MLYAYCFWRKSCWRECCFDGSRFERSRAVNLSLTGTSRTLTHTEKDLATSLSLGTPSPLEKVLWAKLGYALDS
jgi:hypothetical protein